MNYILKKLRSDDYVDQVEIWEAFDEVASLIGENELLLAISKAIGTDELKRLLQEIIRDYDLIQEYEEC